jgi:hypothetical protein
MAEKTPDPAESAERTADQVKKIPAHEGENVTTSDTTPSVERPGHEIETPDRSKG